MNTLICTVGLPRSGKTTWATTWANDHACPIVNPDSIRLAMHGQRFADRAEPLVWATATIMVRSLFLAGHPCVVVDATNTTRKRRDAWQSKDWTTLFYHIATPADVCRERAEAMQDAEILPVIDRMAGQFEPAGIGENFGLPLGATGNYPDGSYAPGTDPEADEGEIRIAVAGDKRAGIVRVEFGKPVAWLGLPQAHAMQLAESLRFHAGKLG